MSYRKVHVNKTLFPRLSTVLVIVVVFSKPQQHIHTFTCTKKEMLVAHNLTLLLNSRWLRTRSNRKRKKKFVECNLLYECNKCCVEQSHTNYTLKKKECNMMMIRQLTALKKNIWFVADDEYFLHFIWFRTNFSILFRNKQTFCNNNKDHMYFICGVRESWQIETKKAWLR